MHFRRGKCQLGCGFGLQKTQHTDRYSRNQGYLESGLTYNRRDFKGSYSRQFDQNIPVGRDTTQFTVDGLINGKPYIISVIATNDEGLSSLPYDIHRVIPTRGPGLTPPVIISEPDTDATAEQQYAYFLF